MIRLIAQRTITLFVFDLEAGFWILWHSRGFLFLSFHLWKRCHVTRSTEVRKMRSISWERILLPDIRIEENRCQWIEGDRCIYEHLVRRWLSICHCTEKQKAVKNFKCAICSSVWFIVWAILGEPPRTNFIRFSAEIFSNAKERQSFFLQSARYFEFYRATTTCTCSLECRYCIQYGWKLTVWNRAHKL